MKWLVGVEDLWPQNGAPLCENLTLGLFGSLSVVVRGSWEVRVVSHGKGLFEQILILKIRMKKF